VFDNCLFSLGYEIEQVSINDFSYAVPDIFKDNSSGLTSALNFMASRDTRNNRISPTKGLYNMVQTEVSGTKLGGDNDFFRVTAKNQVFLPLFWHINLKAYNTIGYIESLNTTTVPLFERYFMGGPNNLRGFFPNSVGPKLRIAGSPEGADSDFVYGGNKYLLFVGELELPLYEPAGFKFVFFMDAGNVFAEEDSFSLTKLRTDYGFGLRWISPFGALRFEWGIPFSPNPSDDPVVFNFGIGEFF
jgi:outer membrane protein insertion porin family